MKIYGGLGRDELMLDYNENDLKTRVYILAAINILEPVTKKKLLKLLVDVIDIKDIQPVLNELSKAGFIAKEKGWYRITYRGISLITSRNAKRLRDIQRMNHLIISSKQRGGESIGR